MSELKIINMEDVEAVPVDWLWYPYIPYGKITIITGEKITMYLNYIVKYHKFHQGKGSKNLLWSEFPLS